MAIIQISKIQQRSGNLVDLPQLDDGQFGWASDAKRLFIGKATPPENIEVLTSYSDISFSQISGSDGGNFNISNVENGQILTFVQSTNTWENWPSSSIVAANANFKVNLGDIDNLKITGNASTGFILQTDGLGNLSWAPKGVIASQIDNVTQANPGVVTTVGNHYLFTGAAITITDVEGMTELNGNVYYANVLTSNTFILCAAPGPTSPVDTSGYTAYTGNGQIVTSIGGSGGNSSITPGGSANSIQFNNSGYLDGSPYFTITSVGNLAHTGPQFTVGNLYANSGNVGANILLGNVLLVSGTANTGNLTVGGFVSATGNIQAGNLITSGVLSVTGNASLSNINVNGNIIPAANVAYDLGNATNLFRDLYLSGTSIKLGTQSITSNASGVALSNGVFTTSLSASGNANVGNIGTGVVVATGNISGGNLSVTGFVRGANLSITGNANISNIGVAGLITATGNVQGGNLIGGNITGVVITASQPNITSVSNTTGLFTIGNLNNGGTYYAPSALVLNSQPAAPEGAQITIGWRGTVGITGQANATWNMDSDGSNNYRLFYQNASGGTGTAITAYSANSDILTGSNLTVSGNASVTGIKTDNYYYANGVVIDFSTTYSNSNVASYLPTYTGTVGTTALTTGANTTAGTITGNWTLSSGSRLQSTYADLAEYYEADNNYEPGTVLEFGGEKEVTLADDGTNRVAGVVSSNPAYVMNAKCEGITVPIALQGRVPCKVRGNIKKGDMLVSAGAGYARPAINPSLGSVIGKALANFNGVDGTIEVAVGRL